MRDWRDGTNWRRLSDVVADLRRRVEKSYHACDDDGAADAHDDLLAAEWRLRRAEERR